MRRFYLFFTGLFCAGVLASGAVMAQNTPPLPPPKDVSLETMQKRIAEEESQRRDLETRLADIEKELEETRASLVRLASQIQDNQERLRQLEGRIRTLSAEEQELTERLEQDFGHIADLVLALERMRRVPPDALIVRPGAPLQTAQSAMLLRGTLPALHNRAESLNRDLTRLAEIKTTLRQDRAAAIQTGELLEKRRAENEKLVARRQTLYERTRSDIVVSQQTIDRLTRESASLQQLLEKLEEERAREAQRQAAAARRAPQASPSGTRRAVMPGTGQARLPVAGYLVASYGDIDAIGAATKGITIEAAPQALVVAPMGGIVRFSGSFQNYRNMVIIEHRDGYHSLIAGLDRVDALTGQTLNAGEPIGKLPVSSSRGTAPALYYELRYRGQPVNPAQRLTDLKS